MLVAAPEPLLQKKEDLIACGIATEDHCILFTAVDEAFSFVLARVHSIDHAESIELTECCWLWFDLVCIGTYPTPDLVVTKSKLGYWTVGPKQTNYVLNYPSVYPYHTNFLSEELYAEMISWINRYQIDKVYDKAVGLFLGVPGAYRQGRFVRAKPIYPETPKNWWRFHKILPIPEHYRRLDW